MSTPHAIDRLCPGLPSEVRACLIHALTRMRPVGERAGEEDASASPGRYILKKEPLGVWAGSELLDKVKQLRQTGKGARDHFVMDKLRPRAVEKVSFVRHGKVLATGACLCQLTPC